MPSAEGLDGRLRLPALEQVEAARVEQVGRDGEVETAIRLTSLLDDAHEAREVRLALLGVDHDVSRDDDHGCAHLHLRLGHDERVVALDPAVRGEHEEAEPDREHLASLATASQWSLTTSPSRSASSRPRKLSPSEPTQCS